MFDRDSSYIWENYKFGILLKETPENRFVQYKITDPYLKNFIARYESLIPWGDIKSIDDINNFISSVLIPRLTKKTKLGDDYDPNNTLYTTKINWNREINALRLAAENGDQNAVISLRSFERDPESTKHKIISDINNSKKRIFSSWENYILRDNEIYKKSPAFQYILLSNVYRSTDNTKTAGLLPLNQAVVANIYDKIKKIYNKSTEEENKESINSTFNILDYYKQTSIEYAGKTHGTFQSGDGKWIKIPSKSNDPDNFTKNVELLMSLASGTNWCIAGESFAKNYLADGDFYIFFRNIDNNQRGVAAIRMDGDQIAEIRGTEANQDMNDMYIQNVLDLVEEEELEGGGQFVKKLQSQKHLKYIKEKINSETPFTEEDRQKMTDVMNIFSYNNIELKCIKINNENKVTLYKKGRPESEHIQTWLDSSHLDLLDGELESYFYMFSDEDYDPFERYNPDHYDPSIDSIRYILNEIDDNYMNQIFDLAFAEGWDITKEVFEHHDMITLRSYLAEWLAFRYDTKIYELIRDGYGRGEVIGEYNGRKNSIIDYLNENLLEFIDKPNNMDWFESYYSLSLNLSNAIKIYESYDEVVHYDFYSALKDYFNITYYNDRSTFDCDDQYAANYIIENLPV